MNKLVHSVRNSWPVLLMAMLFFFGACATTHRDKLLEEAAEAGTLSEDVETRLETRLETQFTAERLSADELAAFESRAKQKLQDFSGYLRLLADRSLDSVFRQQAIRQASALFVNEHAEIVVNSEKEHVIDLLNRFGEDQTDDWQYEIQEINITRPLQPTTDRQYAGILGFQQHSLAANKAVISRQARFLSGRYPKDSDISKNGCGKYYWQVLNKTVK